MARANLAELKRRVPRVSGSALGAAHGRRKHKPRRWPPLSCHEGTCWDPTCPPRGSRHDTGVWALPQRRGTRPVKHGSEAACVPLVWWVWWDSCVRTWSARDTRGSSSGENAWMSRTVPQEKPWGGGAQLDGREFQRGCGGRGEGLEASVMVRQTDINATNRRSPRVHEGDTGAPSPTEARGGTRSQLPRLASCSRHGHSGAAAAKTRG